jgi:hypothetical protein
MGYICIVAYLITLFVTWVVFTAGGRADEQAGRK